MRALVWERPGSVGVREIAPPAPDASSVVIDVAWCGICGSDLHIIAGEHPRAQLGAVLGHEFAGCVASDAAGYSAGTPVIVNPMIPCGRCDACCRMLPHACLNMRAVGVDIAGGLAAQVAVPASAVRAVAGSLSLERAALVEPLAVAIRAVRRSDLQLGDRVHVLGAGPIGRLLAVCAKAAGAGRLTVSEPAPRRRASALDAGLEVIAELDDAGAQVVFDATGHPSVAPTLAKWARAGGSIVVVAAYPPDPVGVSLLDVMFKELRVIGSRVYAWSDIDAAIALLAGHRLDLDGVVSDRISLDEAPEAIDRLKTGAAVKVLVHLQPSDLL